MKLVRITALAAAAAVAVSVMPATLTLAEEQLPYQNESLTFEERAADLVSRMTLEEKVMQTGRNASEISRLGVSKYNYWMEGIHGLARQNTAATSFPSSLSMSNTWDRQLVFDTADITSTEARAFHPRYDLSFWNPTINMARDPRWGRNEESYGEDPYLTTALGGKSLEGMQGTDDKYLKTIATLKHFAANNCEGERQTGTSVVSEKTLREYYTRAFEGIVESSDPASVMSSYNAITMTRNGETVTDYIASSANKYLLTDLLKRTYGFSGYVVGDCGAWENLYGRQPLRQKLYPEWKVDDITAAMVVAKAYEAGNALDCGSRAQASTADSIREEWMSERQLDRAVYELFLQRMRTGEFDADSPYRDIPKTVMESDEHVAMAEKAAEESWVLLENRDSALPLKSNVSKIVVAGDLAGELVLGDYSAKLEYLKKTKTPIDGITEEIKKLNPSAAVEYVGNVNDSTPLFNIKSITLVLSGGKTRTVDLSKAVNVRGMKLSGSELTDVTKSGMAVIKDVDFADVTDVKIEASSKAGMPETTLNIGYDSSTQNESMVKIQNTASESTYAVNTAPYTGALGGYNKTADLYISVSASAEFSVANYKTALDAADYIIAYAGTTTADSKESNDRSSIDLPASQAHVQQICDAYPDKTIVAMSTVGQINVEPFKDKCRALLWTSYNGQTQGEALGKVLTGEVNPSGKLTTTWYAKADLEKMPIGSPKQKIDNIDYNFANYQIAQSEDYPGRTYQYYGGTPVYPFGYGTSYTNYEYSNIKISSGAAPTGASVMITGAEGKNVSVTADKGGAEKAVLICALYNGDGELVETSIKEAENGVNTIELAHDIADGRVKAMLWNSVEKMVPLCACDDSGAVSTSAVSTFAETNSADANDTVRVSVDVKNSGSVDGDEIAQLYVTVPGADGKTLPLKQLKGFERVALKAGETKTVNFDLDISDVCFFDEATGKNYVVPGEYTIKVGANSNDALAQTAKLNVTGTLSDGVKNVRCIPDGVKLIGAKDADTVLPANEINALTSVTLKNDKLISDLSELTGATVTYTSSNEDAATVSDNGVVTAGTTEGTALITASVTMDGVTETDVFPVVTTIQDKVAASVTAKYLAELEAEYEKYPAEAYTAENRAELLKIYTDAKAAIEAELLEGNLPKLLSDAKEAMAAIEQIDLETVYEIKSVNPDIIVNNRINYSAGGIGDYTATETTIEGTITKSEPRTIDLTVFENNAAVDASALNWTVEKLDKSTRKAPEINGGKLTIYENGVFRVCANNYTDKKRGTITVYANLQLEGESADDGGGATLTDAKTGASGGLNAGSTGASWLRFDGVKLKGLTGITFRTSQKNAASTINVSLSPNTDRLIATAEAASTGDWAKWATADAEVNRNELSKLNLDENGCGTIYVQTNGANLDFMKLTYYNSDMDLLNLAGGRVCVSVPYDNCVLVEERYAPDGVTVSEVNDVTVTKAGDYTFENFAEGSKAVYKLYDNLTDKNELTASIENVYKKPNVKALTIFRFDDAAFDSFFETSDGTYLTSGTGMDGYGAWQTGADTRKTTYNGTEYTFTRGLKGGKGGTENTKNVFFTPDADGVVTVFFDASTDRCMYIQQGDKKEEKYGAGSKMITTMEMPVKEGEKVYIYGGGSNKTLYAVFFDTEKEYVETTPAPTPTAAPTMEPLPDITYTQDVEFENYAKMWSTATKTDVGTASGGKVVDNTRNGDIFYFGERDLNGLEAINVIAGMKSGAGDATAEFFAVDMTRIDVSLAEKSTVNALLTSSNSLGKVTLLTDSGGWNEFKENLIRVKTDKTGNYGLFMKTSATVKYCGNYDHMKLMYSDASAETLAVSSYAFDAGDIIKTVVWNDMITALAADVDGNTSVIQSPLGNVWTDITPTSFSESDADIDTFKINDILVINDQLYLGCDGGILVTMTPCSKCSTLKTVCGFDIEELSEQDGKIVLRGGGNSAMVDINAARQANISPEAALDLAKKGARLTDVRSAEEFSEKSVEGSVNVPLDNFESWLMTVPKEDTIIVYCSSGNRAAKAAKTALSLGYTNVYNAGNIDGLMK